MPNSPPNPENPSGATRSALRSPLLTSLLLFLLALIPRLFDLGRFLTADEFLWADRSRNFLAGLTNPAYQCTTVVEKWASVEGLACTLRTGHPGVTTMWTGSFGFILRWLLDGRPAPLHDYVVAVSTNPLDPTFIAPERLGTVLITSLWVVAVYWLSRRLFGAGVALAAAILLALDPFHIAYSRVIHHDALSTTFMTLSVLTAFLYWGEHRQRSAGGGRLWSRGWLLLSGVLAGLAFLSKLASLFLLPYIALVGLWFTFAGMRDKNGRMNKKNFIPQPSALSLLIGDGLLWFAAAMAAFFIFWPAMWVIPVETLQAAFSLAFQYSTGPHAKGVFFLGQSVADPGPLFYPVTWLYHTSPLVMIGLVAALVAWLVTLKKSRGAEEIQPSAFIRYLPLMLLFVLGYYLLMTIGEKKQDRYFLPVYPWLNLIAAFGLVWIYDLRHLRRSAAQVFTIYDLILHAPRSPLSAPRSPLPALRSTLLALLILFQAVLVYANFPYYFTYYNPLLGGLKGAAKVLTIGWGEGLDLAAGYLNQHTQPAQTRVASWYESTFAPFYHGPSISYSKEKGKVLAGDYAVFYINQTQRQFPDEVLFDYFNSRFEPIHTITLAGLDYAWIYPSLGVDHYIQDQTYTGIASLLAWQWANGDRPLTPGQPADFELYWEYLGKQPEEHFFFRLVDAQGRPWAEGESRPVEVENPPPEQWREGEIIVERGALNLPPDLPPGQYQLQIGFYTQAPAVTAGELLFVIPPEEALVAVSHSDRPHPAQLPATANPIEQPLGPALTLLGAAWPTEPLPTAAGFPLDLYWRVEQPLPAGTELHLGLMDQTGAAQQGWFSLTLAEIFNPAAVTWQPGDLIHTRWQLDLLPETPAGDYQFELVLADDTTVTLPFGQLLVVEESE